MRGVSFEGLKARWSRAALGLVFAAGCAAVVAAGARKPADPDIVSVRLGGDAAVTRIVIDLHQSASGDVDPANSANQLAVTLKGATSPGVLRGKGHGLVRDWVIADSPGGARLTLDLAQSADIQRRFLLPPSDGVTNYRYVVDIAPRAGQALAAAAEHGFAAADAAPPAPAPTAAPHLRKIIVLDPGHGGKDSGALGASSYEKNVTLAEALALKARLEKTGRYQVVMTRASDIFIPLEQRVQIARQAGADLFLSLHADSGSDPAIHGASVYTLSERGQERVGYVLGRHEWFLQQAVESDDRAVGQILLDLTQRSTRNRSAGFAQTLIEHVGDRAALLPRSQRDAGYFVLLAPDVPAALLEMGFITNSSDESRLNDPQQRTALADKIAQSIDGYFASRTRLAER
ncbi:MAG TPA: N-acetylmuramoyl-L-alanine amidase [Caulobacteraceae bacterium]|jgi:N-acetylmuramoyl-L-alanine amidase